MIDEYKNKGGIYLNRLDEIKDKFKDLGVLAGSDVVWLLMMIKDLQNKNENQVKIIESQATIIDELVSDSEKVKEFLLRANECYINNKDIEVNANIIKALDVLKLIES